MEVSVKITTLITIETLMVGYDTSLTQSVEKFVDFLQTLPKLLKTCGSSLVYNVLIQHQSWMKTDWKIS